MLLSNSSSCWNERLMPPRARLYTGSESTASPFMWMLPFAGLTKPVIASISVVLPAPFGPIRPTISPALTVTETSLTATTPPKRTVMFEASSVPGSTGSRTTSGSGGHAHLAAPGAG